MSGIKSKNCINCSADLENAENQNPRTSAFYTLNCSSRVRSPLSPATVELIPVPHALSTIFNFQTLEKVTQKANNNHPDDGDGMTGTGTGANEDRDRDRNRNWDPLKDFETTASSVPICFVCYLVLSDLYKSYAEFSQLRNKNSFLGSKLLELENHYSANKDQNRSQFQQPKLNHHRDRDPLKYQNRNTNASHFSQEINLQSQNANVTPISNSNDRVGHGPSSAPAPVPNDSSISDHLITSDLPLQAASRLHSHSIRNFPLQYQIQNEHPNRSLIAGQPAPQNTVPSEVPPLPEGYGLEEGLPDHTRHPPMDFVKLEVFEDETGTDNMDLENSRDLTEEEDAGDVGDYEDESMSSYPSSSFLMEATLGTARTGTGIGNYAAPSTSSAVVGSGDIDPFDSQHVPLLLRLQPPSFIPECHDENDWKIEIESDSTGAGTGQPIANRTKKPKPRSYYLCSVENCGSSFTVKSSLQRHLDEVHNMSREFSCPYCSKEFARSRLDRFKSHLMKCHFKKPEPT